MRAAASVAPIKGDVNQLVPLPLTEEEHCAAEPAVEALHVTILHGLARRDVIPVHLVILAPASIAISGLPRLESKPSGSQATRAPDSEMSATNVRHSRVKSSTTVKMRNRRPSMKASTTKPSDQRWLAPGGIAMGAPSRWHAGLRSP